jgi:hypothetical protein
MSCHSHYILMKHQKTVLAYIEPTKSENGLAIGPNGFSDLNLQDFEVPVAFCIEVITKVV